MLSLVASCLSFSPIELYKPLEYFLLFVLVISFLRMNAQMHMLEHVELHNIPIQYITLERDAFSL